MEDWLGTNRSLGGMGLGDLAAMIGIRDSLQISSVEEINRDFAQFVISEETGPELKAQDRKEQSMLHMKRVGGKDCWELENCPASVYDELDRRGLVPPMGVVSRPRNTPIASGRESEVLRCLGEMGVEYRSDYPG
jgi:hypothetical protein